MRKLFLSMAAVAALLTSCSKDETTTAPVIERSKVTFTVNAPELSTRAGEGNGTTATKLEYVIYDLAESPENGANQIKGTADFSDNSDGDNNPLTTTVEVDLVEGREYEAIFFAHAEGAPYTINWTAQTMTINHQGLTANNEKYDAFFKYVEPFEIEAKDFSVDVEMKRPFAQLNVATIDYQNDDYPAGKMIDAATTGVEVEAYTSMDLKTGNVDKASKQTIKYDLANKMSGTITANNENYSWLSMNYILVNARENVGVKFYFTDVDGSNATRTYTREYTAVPVERNYRTNIVGTILTSPTEFNVEIKPEFVTPNIDWDVDKVVTNTSSSFDEMSVSIEEFMNSITDTDTDNDPAPGTYIFKIEDIVASNYAPAKLQGSVTRSSSTPHNIIIHQVEGYNVIIDGSGNEFDGTFEIYGHARSTGAETLTFTNINFETSEQGEVYFIDSNLTTAAGRYAHNVTIENCTFNNNNASSIVDGMRFRQAYNIRIVNCEVKDNIWALIWADSCTGITIDGVDATKDFKEGAISVGQSTNIAIKNVNIKAANSLYGVRADGKVATTLSIENSSIEAMVPVAVRYANAAYNVALKGQNTLKATGLYDVIFTAANINNPASLNNLTRPTGNWSITGAEGLNVYPTAAESGEFNANSNAQLSQAIAAGATTVNLEEGTYIIPDAAQGKTLTIIGTGDPEDTKIATQDDGSYEGCDYSLDGSTVVFENVSINTDSSTYTGYARMKGTYKNCIINGTYTLYDNSVFEDCTFTVSGDVYNIWTWGAPTATFTRCTFNCDGKAMLLYGTANTKLTMNDCIFNDNGNDTITGKAAIEIGNDYNKSYELIVNKATVKGFSATTLKQDQGGTDLGSNLWGNKDRMPKDKLNVVVDGVDVY